eukprot:CAMPEP_0203669480 /NCGR_PEP_ID=MMETSP0090-20130426/5849_1 /ASSEMBLY_ACC=CAM_ASM_001088 /TAXON_ID=426623 /ORGANISM="Chaetoceros affinis, Strain CCMP159" /LENGTH=912 /DNA_ID=CAMNT_0050534183 /DNA_START=114 /DNA_END=2852 /DNA_ORIENTATION=-
MSDEAPPPPLQPPPSQAITPPPKTSYHSARQQELDAIRRKGLAKIFNKHFTTVASKIQHERQTAELALAELERRKAELSSNPKSFSNDAMTLTQLEKLHMELRKRKHEVFRKERETQELYRRYVSQYGSSDLKAPCKEHVSKIGMPILHEHSLNDIVWQSDLMHTKATEKQEATKDADVGKLADNFNDTSNTYEGNYLISPPSSHSKLLPGSYSPTGNQSNFNFGNGNSSGNVCGVSNGNFVGNSDGRPPRTPDVKAPSPSISSKQTHSGKQLKSFDSPTPTSTTSLGSTSSEAVPRPQENANPPQKSPPSVSMSFQADRSIYSDILGGVMVTTKSSNRLDDCDDSDSTMSGLTTLDGATVVEAEWRLTEFLQIETENIRKMFAAEEQRNDCDSFSNDLISDNSHPSIVVGEVSQAANKAEEMAREMEKATAWMKDPTLLDSDSEEDEADGDGDGEGKSGTEKGDNAVPEWSCFWSEEHEREYYYNNATGQTCWTKPQEVDIDFSPAKKIKGATKKDEGDQNEQDSVITSSLEADGDSVTVKDYTKSRRVLVESQALNPTEFTNEEMIDVFRPDTDNRSVSSKGSTKQSSKVLQYRRKRAKLRRTKRRLRAAFALSTIASIALFVYRDQWLPFLQGKTPTSQRESTNPGQSEEEMPKFETEKASVDVQEKSESLEIDEQKSEDEKIKIQIEAQLQEEGEMIKMDGQREEEERRQKEQEMIEIEAQRKEEERQQKEQEKIRIEEQRKEAERKQKEQEKIRIETQRKEQERLEETKKKEEEALKLKLEKEKEEEEEKARIELQRKEEVNNMEATMIKKEEESQDKEVNVDSTQQLKEQEKEQVKYEETTKRDKKEQKDKKAKTESEQKKTIQKVHRRPPSCGIPFAYIPSRKCRTLATTNPIYDCKALTDSMME